MSFAKNSSGLFIKKSVKRINNKFHKGSTKHLIIHEILGETIIKRWNMGLPICKEELQMMCLNKSDEPGWEEWAKIYGAGDVRTRKKLQVFLSRGIEKIGFAVRKETVPQKIQDD